MNTTAILCLLLLLTPCVLSAHEYWLDPIESSITRGSSAIVDVRNGEHFAGSAYPYDKSQLRAISISGESDSQIYQGRLGDYPAIHPEFDKLGLYSIHVETTPQLLTYKTWQQFNTFLEYHALTSTKEQHTKRDLPRIDISERYYRSAKTLIQVTDNGALNIADSMNVDIKNHKAFAATGAKFELLMLDNPYSETDNVRVKLLYQSKPLRGRQVEMFWKGSTLIRLTEQTNENGIASFKLLGDGDYLLNSVNIETPDNEDVDWLSYWASVTFER